ncbi:hypothetical protein PRIPAC_97601 [Pristionchus pacificus]|uniref:Membrane transporter n=1 Tax=Pristionchus pacificus TaxID=54126 RepID=A0A2A6BK75_PRIPA|nr:hypothetical protein PRIPAC_97601 [Pristionchus pacificus]|eukprot:PDM66191.1 membrane transporter [Pristionchus pacificus]
MSASPPPSATRNVAVLVLALVIDMLAFTCILPLFPSIISFYSKTPHRDGLYDFFVSFLASFQRFIGVPYNERYNNVFFGGFLGSLFSALQFISSPTLGSLSDVYGRKTMLLLSAAGTLVSHVMWLRADTFTLFVLARFVGGLSKANVNVATAIIADVYEPKDHPKGMALIGASYSIGFLIGPMIGAYFSVIAPKNATLFTLPAQFSIVVTFIHFLIIAFCLRETLDHKQTKSRESVTDRASLLVRPSALFKFSAVNAPTEKKQRMESIGWTYFLYLFLYAGLEFTLPFLTHLRFDFGSMQQSKIYLFTGLLMLPIQGGYVRRTPLHKQKRLAEIGLMCIIPAFLICAIAHSVVVLYIGLALYAVASATVVPTLTSLISVVHETDKGAVAGVFRSIGALARALGPIFASTIFWLLGPEWCYVIGGISLVLPLALLRRIPNVESPLEKEKMK